MQILQLLTLSFCMMFSLPGQAQEGEHHHHHNHDMHKMDMDANKDKAKDNHSDHTMGKMGKMDEHSGHHHHHHGQMESSNNEEKVPTKEEIEKGVGIDEKLGAMVPLNLSFYNEENRPKNFKEILGNKPTLLLLVFYSCPDTCSIMLGQLGNALAAMNMRPLEDYHAVTISFDSEEGPEMAKIRKGDYFHLTGKNYPEKAWQFYRGDSQNISELTSALGYRFMKLGVHNFVHPNVLIALSPEGKVIRYLYGPNFLPFDLSMAMSEATKGTPVTSIRKLLTYCFSYDSKGKKYVFNFLQVAGTVIFLLLMLFSLFLIRRPKVSRNRFNNEEDGGHEKNSDSTNK
jgi:protein SCO1/2